MDLKSFLPGSEKEKEKEYFWSLIIEPGWVQAGIWDIEGEKAEVVSISPSVAWEEELLEAADAALSTAIQNLPEDMPEPRKTVFGVISSWVSEGAIKEEYLEKIRKICSELSLKPVGFVVLPEAISHLSKAQEGAPLNACVLGVGKDSLEIALFRLGNLTGTSQIARSVSIVDDVAEGLVRFAGSEAFPSRIILYDGKEGELEEVKQALLNVTWESFEKIKFLHSPKIEIFAPEKKMLAVCLAGASEMANVKSVASAKVVPGMEKPQEEEENITVGFDAIKPEELGFVLGKDVSTLPKIGPVTQEIEKPLVAEKTAIDTGGFQSTGKVLPTEKRPFFARLKLPSLTFLKNLRIAFPRPKLAFHGKKIITFGILSFAIIFILGFGAWWFLPKAVVTVYVSPQKLEESAEVVVDPNANSPDLDQKIIPGKVISETVSGEKTKGTTGTKTVGEKSKGSVKIQNGTSSDIALAAGTILLATNDLKFVTDSSVTVAAALSPSNPGTSNVDVAASDIGAEYNLAKDESFKVGNYPKSEVDAVSTSDFGGGSSRQISAVSEEDQKTLEKELVEELINKAKNELSQKVSDNEILIADSATSEESEKNFANKVGDEAETLKLNLTLEVSGFSVSKVQLTDLAMETLKSKVPSGYVLREGQITNDFEFEEETENGAKIKVLFKANLLPEVKPDEIAKAISGKYPSLAQDYLTGIKGFSRAEIKIKPALPGRLKTLPRLSKNIEVEIAAD